ncbi:uncharacterized protein L3040_004901 [Drepanopeziza brunnea f. sp. 'multigermtubi']|uniref:Uncharacterized protein n=1 Tax=Marssonina brunnea f. sp. multigermtubi (strain MB_m1) TaxID=1072389 RepID=K1Y968_MARBU|nr:uncharacterized protein MBM_00792 [Drepanopeziza brunnea f. sp. 'multigermtubi' MB_m1]EKD21679.1 hypothetical protein MBM_00792 [Drepanopeziza brunnea f. sp. 'multigermtubi' MB_m1]KAJ5042350.1 hypothetical protein L3040_004901 [Drepanopeziza brunnea f. sp. 'multigermtubi']
MFESVRTAVKAQLQNKVNVNEAELLSSLLPESYSLAQICDELVTDEDQLESLLILSGCFDEFERLQREDNDEESSIKLSLWVSKAIVPGGDCVSENEAFEDKPSSSRNEALRLAQRKGTLGLKSLQVLCRLNDSVPDTRVLLSVLAFTSQKDPWTTSESASIAQQFFSLPSIQRYTSNPEFIPQKLLQEFTRPLFSASKPESITTAGRKAMPSTAPPKRHDFVNEKKSQPWRYEVPYSIAVLEWAVQNASDEIILTSWPLIIPPLLTLLDTPTTPLLVRGLNLTTTFLPRLSTKPQLLTQTGLFSVFEEAILPTTLYLPSITPLEDSLLILPAAYSALFALYTARFQPTPHPSPAKTETETEMGTVKATINRSSKAIAETEQHQRLHFLDRVFRRGILPAASHTSSSSHSSAITIVLLAHVSPIVEKLGMHAVKHLKSIIPMLAQAFCVPRYDLIQQALRTLQVVILNCWARIGEEAWRIEVVRMLVVCKETVHVFQLGREDVRMARLWESMAVVGRLLVRAVEGRVDMREELRPLVEADAEVGEVFGI